MGKRSIPSEELSKIAAANTGNVSIAGALVDFVRKNPAAKELVKQIDELAANVTKINEALTKTL